MEDFNRIIENIRNTRGIKRIKISLNSYEKAEEYFVKIANAFLEWKNIQYDISEVRPYVKKLINWAYMLGEDLDFTKGIILKGKTGRGKTFLFNVFTEFLKIDNLQYVSNGKLLSLYLTKIHARQLASNYQKNGYEVIDYYSKVPCLFIDDIGTEMSQSQNFGNKINVVENLLDMREDNNLLTFATTNLEKFSEQYDDRLISRMNSLFNVISINHDKDYRGL